MHAIVFGSYIQYTYEHLASADMFNCLTQIKNISWQLFVVELRAIIISTGRLLGVQLNDSISMTSAAVEC